MPDLVCIKAFPWRHEAELAKGFLASRGIRAAVDADDCGGMRPHLAFTGGARLLVREDDAERAMALLDGAG